MARRNPTQVVKMSRVHSNSSVPQPNARPKRMLKVSVACLATLTAAAALAACGSSSSAQSAASLVSAGITAQNSGDNATASTDYTAALAIQPKNVYALFDLGDVQQFMGNTSAAESNYFHALAVDPSYEPAMFNLATLEAKHNPGEARSLYLQVIKLSPRDADAHFNLGYVLISMGQSAAGHAQINLAVKLDPTLKRRETPS